MNVICDGLLLNHIRGMASNCLLMIFFVISLITNTVCATLILINKRKNNNLTLYLIIELLIANLFIFSSQIFHSSTHIFSTITCVEKVCIYIIHETGVQLSASSILSIIILHHRIVSQIFPISLKQRKDMTKKIIMLQLVTILTGLLFIIVPFATTKLIGQSPSEVFHFSLHAISLTYCFRSRKGIQQLTESVSGTNAQILKRESKWVVMTTGLVATLQLIFDITRIISVAIETKSNDALLVIRLASLVYYIALLLFIVIITVFRVRAVFKCKCSSTKKSSNITTLAMRSLSGKVVMGALTGGIAGPALAVASSMLSFNKEEAENTENMTK